MQMEAAVNARLEHCIIQMQDYFKHQKEISLIGAGPSPPTWRCSNDLKWAFKYWPTFTFVVYILRKSKINSFNYLSEHIWGHYCIFVIAINQVMRPYSPASCYCTLHSSISNPHTCTFPFICSLYCLYTNFWGLFCFIRFTVSLLPQSWFCISNFHAKPYKSSWHISSHNVCMKTTPGFFVNSVTAISSRI